MALDLTVAAAPATELTGAAIQALVDQAALAGGGTVRVPAGTYTLYDAVHLRSGVHLEGEEGAVLRKAACVSSPLLGYLGYGHYEFSVRDPDLFRPGMGVHLLDKPSRGFYSTVATIVSRKGELLYIDRMLNHDLSPDAEGRAITLHSLIEATGVEDASVRGLVLDGNQAENERLNGCRGGGVFLLQCQRVMIEDVEVRQFNGDAISFQQCVDIVVRRCRMVENSGAGLHPGSGSVRYVMEENLSQHNGGCGLFYCLRTSHSICRDNTLADNGAEGISIGERDGDHLIEGNTVTGNGGAGVDFRRLHWRGGDRVRLVGNSLGGNGRDGKGRHEVVVTAGLEDVELRGNRFELEGGRRAVRVEAGVRRLNMAANLVNGRPQQADDFDLAAPAEVLLAERSDFPPVGPAALPLDGAAHLNLAKLPPWREPRDAGLACAADAADAIDRT